MNELTSTRNSNCYYYTPPKKNRRISPWYFHFCWHRKIDITPSSRLQTFDSGNSTKWSTVKSSVTAAAPWMLLDHRETVKVWSNLGVTFYIFSPFQLAIQVGCCTWLKEPRVSQGSERLQHAQHWRKRTHMLQVHLFPKRVNKTTLTFSDPILIHQTFQIFDASIKVLVLWRLLQKYAVVPNSWSAFVT